MHVLQDKNQTDALEDEVKDKQARWKMKRGRKGPRINSGTP